MNSHPSKCPTIEYLSACFDGEAVPDEAARSHIAQCPKCTAYLNECAKIREVVSRQNDIQVPDDLNKRISQYIHEQKDAVCTVPSKEWHGHSNEKFAWVLRIAALIAMAAFFVYLVVDNRRVNAEKQLRRQAVSTEVQQPPFANHNSGPSVPVLSAPSNNLIRRVSTGDSGHEPSLGNMLDVSPLLLQSDPFDGVSRLQLNSSIQPTRYHGTIDVRDISAGELYPQLRNALSEMDLPGVFFKVSRERNIVYAEIEIRSEKKLYLIRDENTLELKFINDTESANGRIASPVHYELEFICCPEG